MFVPAFVVRAVRQEEVKVSQDTRYNPSTRKHLLHLLDLLEQAFESCKTHKVNQMFFSIALLIVIVFVVLRVAPRENQEDAHIHGAGQIGLLAALALFGVDYFTSYFYATGEMMNALHPYGLQQYGYIAVMVIAIANAVFGFLYMYSLGTFNEGGGSYTASMRYLSPGLSLVVAVVLIQDYIFTIVVSTLSGVDQLLSLTNSYNTLWLIRFGLGAAMAAVTWYLTIRGRGESARIVFTMLGVFVLMTIIMAIGLFIAKGKGVPPVVFVEPETTPSLWQAFYHMLTASMKGLGRAQRSGSHVQRYSVCKERGLRFGEVGQEAHAQMAGTLGFLQRQIRHWPHGADFIFVLWRNYNFFPGLLRGSFQRL